MFGTVSVRALAPSRQTDNEALLKSLNVSQTDQNKTNLFREASSNYLTNMSLEDFLLGPRVFVWEKRGVGTLLVEAVQHRTTSLNQSNQSISQSININQSLGERWMDRMAMDWVGLGIVCSGGGGGLSAVGRRAGVAASVVCGHWGRGRRARGRRVLGAGDSLG